MTQNFSTIGAGIVHGPAYLKLYAKPVIKFDQRSLSRNTKKRKGKTIMATDGDNMNLKLKSHRWATN